MKVYWNKSVEMDVYDENDVKIPILINECEIDNIDIIEDHGDEVDIMFEDGTKAFNIEKTSFNYKVAS